METSTLLIRHLPSDLSSMEKDDFLRHFGAVSVRVMGTTGRMKHTAFAAFPDQMQAEKAMARLHQLNVLDSRLKVEFAAESLTPDRAKTAPWTQRKLEDPVEKKSVPLPSEDSTYQKWSIDYPRNPRLHYMYPPPSVTILTNIANALASYPKFYVQVLHLMNKMNLPAPFGSLTTTPPLPSEISEKKVDKADRKRPASSSESEIESDTDITTGKEFVPENIYGRKKKTLSKKAKLMTEPPAVVLNQGSVVPPEQIHKPSEVFEQIQEKPIQKKIQMKLSLTQEEKANEPALPCQPPPPEPSPHQTEPDETGFGRIEPVQKEESTDIPQSETNWISLGVISIPELENGILPMSQLRDLSVFRKYDKGEPSCRLYLKNLAKTVTENDLRFIYGRFIDMTSTEELNIFDVRVMKEGRMKGQAFVTLPSENKALTALEKTNGFVIKGKPVAVQFARSAKQKESS